MKTQLPVTQWRILWFSPNAGIWETSQLEHDLANGLAILGAQVTVIRCRGLFDSFCPTMKANGLTPYSSRSQKKSVCRDCRHSASTFQKVARYSTVWIDDYVTHEMQQEINHTMAAVTRDNWRTFGNYEIPINRYATYLAMLHHKVPDITATEESWREYVSDLKNSYFALAALPTIFGQVNPTHCFVYNPLYPTNRVFSELALQRSDVQFVGVSAGGFIPDRYSTLAIYRSIQSSQTAVDSPNLLESMEVPLTSLEVELVARHLGHLVQGRDPWVYSTPPTLIPLEDIHKKIGTSGKKPVAVVLIGSPDETRSSELVGAEFERVPQDQVSSVPEFIEQSLIVARNSPDIDFIFRLHPRLAPNKRESLRSPDLNVIEDLLSNRESNVFINSPDDGIGLYDVARISTLGINHASSAGLEFLALGLPVVHYDPPRLNAYPPSLGIEVARMNPTKFATAISEALNSKPSERSVVDAWRWYAVSLVRALTHRQWTLDYEIMGPENNKAFMQWFRNLIPVSIREWISRKLTNRSNTKRIQPIDESGSPEQWILECVERISNLDNSTIWDPMVFVRGDSLSPSQERHVIESALDQIRKNIGQQDASR